MDCLLHIAASLCLISPSGITVRMDMSSQLAGDVRHWSGGRSYGGALLGHVGVEMPVITYRAFQLNAGVVHESLLNTRSDRGEERVMVGIVWRPLR